MKRYWKLTKNIKKVNKLKNMGLILESDRNSYSEIQKEYVKQENNCHAKFSFMEQKYYK